MKVISTKTHAILDYVLGVFLIIAPWVFGFANGGAATWIMIIVGAGVIVYSLFTNYEYSLSKALSMKTHIWLDIAGGALLAVSPWLFGFSEYVFLPHLILGVAEVGAALMTEEQPKYVRHT